MQAKQFEDFRTQLNNDEAFQAEFQADPLKTVQKFDNSNPLNTDKWIYRMIVISLGISVVLIVLGVIILMGSGIIKSDSNVPTIITALGSAAIGALAGLLAPPPKM